MLNLPGTERSIVLTGISVLCLERNQIIFSSHILIPEIVWDFFFLYRNYYYNIFQPVKWVIYNQNFKNKPTNRLTNSLSLWSQYIMNLIILEKCQHQLVFKSHSPQLQGQNIALLTAKALSFLSSVWPMRNEWICLLSESCHRRPVVRAVISELICHSKMFTGFQPCSLIRDAWSKCDSPAIWSCLKSWDCRIFQWSIYS